MSESKNIGAKLFLNPESELRCGWRVLAFFFALIVAVTLLSGIVGAIGVLIPQSRELLPGVANPASLSPYQAVIVLGIERTMLLVAALAASLICARLLERRSFGSVGFKFHRDWLRDFLLGSALGVVTLCLSVAIATIAGSMSFQSQSHSIGNLAASFTGLFLVFLIAAAFEEILVRGFVFQAIDHNLGPVVALVSTSALFGVLHLTNPEVTALSTINTVLAGVWLGTAYLVTRSLWLATALHYAWNFTMVYVFGLPVSGLSLYKSLSILDGQGGAPVWMSGGEYGPEGGLAATLALVVCTLIVWKSGIFKASEDMIAAIKHNSISNKTESIIARSDSETHTTVE